MAPFIFLMRSYFTKRYFNLWMYHILTKWNHFVLKFLSLSFILWYQGALDPRCKICIFMGKTNKGAAKHKQQSMILVPMDSPGVKVVRPLTVFGYDDAPGLLIIVIIFIIITIIIVCFLSFYLCVSISFPIFFVYLCVSFRNLSLAN